MSQDPIGSIDALKSSGSSELSWGAAAGKVQGVQGPPAAAQAPVAAEAVVALPKDGVHLSEELGEEQQASAASSATSASNPLRALLGAKGGADASNRKPGLQKGGVMTPEGWNGQEPGIANGFVRKGGGDAEG